MAANALFDMPLARERKKYHDFLDINTLSEREIRERFRFGRESIDFLVGLLEDKLMRDTQRSRALTPRQQVLIALRFFATGSFLQIVGDSLGVDKSTVSRVVTDVTEALVQLRHDFISWPNEDVKMEIRRGFFSLGGFPNVIGCIDGTHIRIQAPSEDEKSFVNRKSYHSINVMAVCDHKGKVSPPTKCKQLIYHITIIYAG